MVNRPLPARMRFARRWQARCGLILVLFAPLGCGRPNASAAPVPALAQSPEGQQTFRELSERWHAARSEEVAALSDDFRRYLSQYGTEDQSRLARAYLAWLDVTTGNLLEARELIEVTRRGPPGRARDFAVVAEAALLVKHGHAHDALKLLRPLQGKIIDPTERYYATQQLVLSAMAANLYAEGLSQVVAWLQQAKPQQREGVRQTIRELVARVPTRYLEKALESEQPNPSHHSTPAALAEHQWLYQVIALQLATIAVQQKDTTLARRVLENGTPVGAAANRSELVRLASGSGANATIAGYTVGVVLNTGSAHARRRSSQAVTGLSVALNMLQAQVDPRERVRLLFTDDATDLAQGLAELAAAGASILATGFGEDEATVAARYAARVRIPIVLFVRPRIASNYAFVLGVGEDEQRRHTDDVANAALVSELECDVASESSKATGFPLAMWAAEGRTSLYLLGDAACSQRLLTEMRGTNFTPELWLGLESAHLHADLTRERLHTLQTGHFPFTPGIGAEVDEFAQLLGHQPTWFETLGRDAAVIVTQVMSKLPRIDTSADAKVSSYHAQVQSRLVAFESSVLWSTTARAFDHDMRLQRTLTWQ